MEKGITGKGGGRRQTGRGDRTGHWKGKAPGRPRPSTKTVEKIWEPFPREKRRGGSCREWHVSGLDGGIKALSQF